MHQCTSSSVSAAFSSSWLLLGVWFGGGGGERETTTFTLPFNGRADAGNESHVLRPIITALIHFFLELGLVPALAEGVWAEAEAEAEAEEGEGEGGTRLVTRAKKRRSGFMGGQGRVLARPMPRVGVEATMRVRPGRDDGVIGAVGGIGVVEVEVEDMVGLME